MKIKFRTLSPLHIGTGEELAPMDYITHNGTFYRIPQDAMLGFIDQLGQGDIEKSMEVAEKFASWVSGSYQQMKVERDNRALSAMADRMNSFEFCASIGKEGEFLDFLNKSDKVLKAPVFIDNWTLNHHRGAATIPLGRVREAVKNGNGLPLVPGSSIKGALRTAAFYHFLSQHADSKRVERMVREQLSSRRARKERFALPLAHYAFFCATRDVVSDKVKGDDEKMDLFKLVRIRDAHQVGGERSLALAKINIYLVEKRMGRDKSQPFLEATQQRQTSYAEVIPPGHEVETEMDFDIDFLLQAKPFLGKEGIRSGSQLQWIGLEEKVRQLFGIELAMLTADNKEAMREQAIEHLLACLQAFCKAQLQASQEWLEFFAEHDNHNKYAGAIQAGYRPVFNSKQVLMNLGYATGFEGMTALLYFLADKNRKALFKEVMEHFGLGNKPGNRGRFKPNPDRFPKSKRLVEMARDSIQPMGWVELFREGEELPPVEIARKEAKTLSGVSREEVRPPAPELKQETGPAFFEGEINYKKPPLLDAVVVKSGRPNRVKVYLKPDNSPEMDLMSYSNPLEKGKVVCVQPSFNRKMELLQVAFRGLK